MAVDRRAGVLVGLSPSIVMGLIFANPELLGGLCLELKACGSGFGV